MEIGLFCKVIFDIVNHLQNRISMKRTIFYHYTAYVISLKSMVPRL